MIEIDPTVLHLVDPTRCVGLSYKQSITASLMDVIFTLVSSINLINNIGEQNLHIKTNASVDIFYLKNEIKTIVSFFQLKNCFPRIKN